MSTVSVRMLLAFFAIYVVWGSTYFAIRVAVETIPPLATAGVRHLVAGVVLYAWARAWRAHITWIEWRASLVVAVLFLIGHGTLHWAEQIVPSGIAALLVATEPAWIATDARRHPARRAGALASSSAWPPVCSASPCWCRSRRSPPAGPSRRSRCGAPARF